MGPPRQPLGKLDASAIGTRVLPRLSPDVLDGFRALGDLTGTASDAMDQCGIAGAVPGSTLRPTDPGARLVGQAVTVLNRPLDQPVAQAVARRVSRLGEIEAHNLAEPGDVLVIQGVAEISSMGGISAAVGKRQGEAGAVVDGAVRDIDRSRAIGYPVWASGVSPITGKWRIATVAVNVPVVIAGVPVRPGDLVLADAVGVCFVPAARAAEVLAVARRLAEAEAERLGKLAAGIGLAAFAALPRKARRDYPTTRRNIVRLVLRKFGRTRSLHAVCRTASHGALPSVSCATSS
jgi:regulator of RNase E activity RraA